MKAKIEHGYFPHSYKNHYTYKERFCVKTYQFKSGFQTASKMSLISAIICSLLATSSVSSQHAELNSTQITGKVSGREPASREDHLLFFFQNNVLKGQGFVIAKRLAISSAQSFFEVDISGYKASNYKSFRIGIETRMDWTVFNVEKVEVHEHFTREMEEPYLNDIAVVLLERATISESPVLPQYIGNSYSKAEFKFIGMGEDDKAHHSFMKYRVRAHLLENNRRCEYVSQGRKVPEESFMCVGFVYGHSTQNDMGSPLLVALQSDSPLYGLIGIHTMFIGGVNDPAIFTRVSYYYESIKEMMQKLKDYACQSTTQESTDFDLIDGTYRLKAAMHPW